MLKRLLTRRNLFIAAAFLLLVAVSGAFGVWVVFNSPGTNERVRQYAVMELEARTGGKASLDRIGWSLWQQRIFLEGLVIRGSEPANEPPLAQVESVMAGINLRSLLQRRVDLFELTLERPQFHVTLDANGRTNLPTPPPRNGVDQTFSVSVTDLKMNDGTGIVNHRRFAVDLALANLKADLTYRSATDVLSAQVTYEGTVAQPGQPPQRTIPYTMSTAFDATRGTLLIHRAEMKSGNSTATVQGRIDRALTEEISSRLAYSGRLDSAMVARFFPGHKLRGAATTTGSLQFSPGSFGAQGSLASDRLELDGWAATAFRAKYDYASPSDALKLSGISGSIFSGKVTGNASTTLSSEPRRINADLQFQDLDVVQLAPYYPWDHRYVIYSTSSGSATGWVEDPMHFEFDVASELSAYPPVPTAGITAFPMNGSLNALVRPADVELRSADVRFFETSIQASGRINPTEADLTLKAASTNLANLRFIHKDANGDGSFEGTVKGPLRTPLLDGRVMVEGLRRGGWTVRRAEGAVTLDTQNSTARMALTGTIGESTASVNGTASLDGSQVNVRIQSDRVRASDFAAALPEKIEGTLGGDVTLTSLDPLRFSGHIRGENLVARGETVSAAEGDVTVAGPVIEIRNLTGAARGARLTAGAVAFNRTTEAIDARGEVAPIDFERFRDMGIPDGLKGSLTRARLRVTGALRRPLVSGDASAVNLTFRSETLPRASLAFNTQWPYLDVDVREAGNVDLSARIDLSERDNPFEATAQFRDYPLEQLSGFTYGTLRASGDVRLKSTLAKDAMVSGGGTLRSIHAKIGQYDFDGAKPFAFTFDANRVEIAEDAILVGALGTNVTVRGTVALTNAARLDLSATGAIDLTVLAAVDPDWSVTGTVAFDGRIGGTVPKPTIDGRATLRNASLGREGLYTTLSALNGTIRFNENRVTFDNIEGRAGGGGVRFRGTGLIQNERMEGLDVQIDADQVRLRYPEGLRAALSGTLLLKGTSTNPILDGNLRIDNMAYRSSFESFLEVFRPGGLNTTIPGLETLQLAVHVAGSRNIGVQNELADVTSARVDVDLKGTLVSPSLTGHIETNDGTLLFQGKRYTITRGNLDFIDPLRIDPVIDIQAEADLRDYRVILAVTGRGERVRVEFRSDPPLPQLELVSLIAGGRTREELAVDSRAASLPTSEQLFQGGAASILMDLLRSRVGSRFGLLGLDRVRIDPYLVGTGSNPSARITLSERLTKDLSVTYSQDLASSQQRIIQIEYFLSKDLSVVASREEDNETTALGLDVRLRKRF